MSGFDTSFQFRTMDPKYTHYPPDGSGRDSYITSKNGGLSHYRGIGCKEWTGTAFRQKSSQRISPGKSDVSTLRYRGNGSGRDSYIYHNSGGLQPPYSMDSSSFITSLRHYAVSDSDPRNSETGRDFFKSAQQNRYMTSSQRHLLKTAAVNQKRQTQRLSTPKTIRARHPAASSQWQLQRGQSEMRMQSSTSLLNKSNLEGLTEPATPNANLVKNMRASSEEPTTENKAGKSPIRVLKSYHTNTKALLNNFINGSSNRRGEKSIRPVYLERRGGDREEHKRNVRRGRTGAAAAAAGSQKKELAAMSKTFSGGFEVKKSHSEGPRARGGQKKQQEATVSRSAKKEKSETRQEVGGNDTVAADEQARLMLLQAERAAQKKKPVAFRVGRQMIENGNVGDRLNRSVGVRAQVLSP